MICSKYLRYWKKFVFYKFPYTFLARNLYLERSQRHPPFEVIPHQPRVILKQQKLTESLPIRDEKVEIKLSEENLSDENLYDESKISLFRPNPIIKNDFSDNEVQIIEGQTILEESDEDFPCHSCSDVFDNILSLTSHHRKHHIRNKSKPIFPAERSRAKDTKIELRLDIPKISFLND